MPDNPTASTLNRIEKKQRKRHTIDGMKAIREMPPAWLQNAIDQALITAQRRTDILNIRSDGVRESAGCYQGWKDEQMPGFHEGFYAGTKKPI